MYKLIFRYYDSNIKNIDEPKDITTLVQISLLGGNFRLEAASDCDHQPKHDPLCEI